MIREPEVDDFLAHYGVKGMKWGVRKSRDGGPSKPSKRQARKAARAANDEAIKTARTKQAVRTRRFEEAQAKVFLARSGKGEQKAMELVRKRENELYNSEDYKKSQEWTTGEKWANGTAIALYGAMVVGSIAVNQALKNG